MWKRETVLMKRGTYRRQDLGLGDDAVGQTVLPALSSNLCPSDLEARDSLTGGQSGHAPQEVPSDISLINWERSRQVLWFSQNLRNTQNCWKNNGISHVHDIVRMTLLDSYKELDGRIDSTIICVQLARSYNNDLSLAQDILKTQKTGGTAFLGLWGKK